MTRAGELLALAERCQRATRPDRYLDAQIASVMRLERVPHWARNWTGEWMATEQGSVLLMEADGEPGPHFMAREYTGSLDAALTLVPDRYRWSVKGDGTGTLPFSYTAKVGERGNEPSWNDHYSFPCATPALALCAAALRAKAGES